MAAAGTGSADLLVLRSPAGPAAMMYGPAGAALASGPAAFLGNPAFGMDGFAASGGRWNLSTTAVTAAGGISPGGMIVGAGITYLGKSDLVARDPSGEVTGGYSFSTGRVLAGASVPLSGWLSAGASVGIAWEDPGTGAATGIAAGAGIAGTPSEAFRFGAAVTGLGVPPSWNGVTKDMPAALVAGLEWSVIPVLALFAGGELGYATAGSVGGGVRLRAGGLDGSAGFGAAPGEEEITGLFGGIGYEYVSGGTYRVEVAFAQRRTLDWPVMAGISVDLP